MKAFFTRLRDWLVQDEPVCPDEPSWEEDTLYDPYELDELEMMLDEDDALYASRSM